MIEKFKHQPALNKLAQPVSIGLSQSRGGNNFEIAIKVMLGYDMPYEVNRACQSHLYWLGGLFGIGNSCKRTEEEIDTLAEQISELAICAILDQSVPDGGPIQALLADVLGEALFDRDIQADMLKSNPVKLSEAVDLAQNSDWVWSCIRRLWIE